VDYYIGEKKFFRLFFRKKVSQRHKLGKLGEAIGQSRGG
jgi:hypothetical protein